MENTKKGKKKNPSRKAKRKRSEGQNLARKRKRVEDDAGPSDSASADSAEHDFVDRFGLSTPKIGSVVANVHPLP
jgi:hypothetical protein